jgi:SAM-dependent methyltransferase
MSAGRHYSGAGGERYFAYQRELGELGAVLDARKIRPYVGGRETVVDFGCGAGGILLGLGVPEPIGIEVNEAGRRVAASRGLRVVASAAELPDATADMVISNHALEHTTAPLEELRELARILKPDGVLALWLPIDDWRAQRRPDPAEPNHHLYTWTPQLIHNLLSEAGFHVQRTQIVTHAWPPRTEWFMRLPDAWFDVIARVWAVARRRRQLLALAAPR